LRWRSSNKPTSFVSKLTTAYKHKTIGEYIYLLMYWNSSTHAFTVTVFSLDLTKFFGEAYQQRSYPWFC